MKEKRAAWRTISFEDALAFAAKHAPVVDTNEPESFEVFDLGGYGYPNAVAVACFRNGARLAVATYGDGPPYSDVTPDPQWASQTTFWVLDGEGNLTR